MSPHTPGKACETVYRFHMSLGAELAPLYFRVDILETPMNLFISVRNMADRELRPSLACGAVFLDRRSKRMPCISRHLARDMFALRAMRPRLRRLLEALSP